MYYFLTASKDASVYLQQPNQNTGLDEILEISKVYYGNIKDVSHTLLKFDVGYISASISNNSISMSAAELILKETKSEEIPLEYTIYANPISGSWEMGIGTRFDNISTAGVTWNNREGDSTLRWLPLNEFVAESTGSYEGKGGTFYYTVFGTQNFEYKAGDPFIPYENTEAFENIVIGWLEGVLDVVELKAQVDDEIQGQTSPKDEILTFTWQND